MTPAPAKRGNLVIEIGPTAAGVIMATIGLATAYLGYRQEAINDKAHETQEVVERIEKDVNSTATALADKAERMEVRLLQLTEDLADERSENAEKKEGRDE
jgi:glutamate dehydrogenase/leucine dehydrogenase